MAICTFCHYCSQEPSIPCAGERCGACTDLEKINADIVATKKHLEDLLSRRQYLLTKHNLGSDLLTQTLPVKLVSKIFSMSISVCRIEDVVRKTGWYTSNITPYFLSSICKAWMGITRSTPELWIHLRFSLGKQGVGIAATYVQIANSILQRSKSMPLHIAVFGRPISNAMETHFPDFSSLLNAHSSRWSSVFFDLKDSHASYLCGSGESSNQIRHLAVNNGSFRLRKSKTRPSLMMVSEARLSRIHVDWHNTPEIHLIGISGLNLFKFLRLASKLKKLVVGRINVGQSNRPVSHATLETLVIAHCPAPILTTFGNLPALSYCHIEDSNWKTSFEPFIDRQKECHLASLRIDVSEYRRDTETLSSSILRKIPTLKHLTYTGSDSFSPFLSDMVESNNTGRPILPALETLTLQSGCHYPMIKSFPWQYISGLFVNSASSRRPLVHMCIRFERSSWADTTQPYIFQPSYAVPERYLDEYDAIDSGLPHRKIEIEVTPGFDFRAMSRNHHELQNMITGANRYCCEQLPFDSDG